MNSTEDMKSTEVAVLLDNNVNKYNPGIQTFRLQSTGGLQSNTRGVYQQGISTNNLLNEDKSFVTGNVYKASVVRLRLPREVTINFSTKFIPVGTRFIVSYNSGDPTKPVIVGREYEADGY